MWQIYAAIPILCLVAVANSHSGGATDSACETMKPAHVGSKPQVSPIPASFKIDVQCTVKKKVVKVTVTAKNSFKGLLVQVRKKDSDKRTDGTFTEFQKDSFELLSCPPDSNNALTHSSNAVKASTTFTWESLKPKETNDVLVVSYVEERTVYWVQHKEPLKDC